MLGAATRKDAKKILQRGLFGGAQSLRVNGQKKKSIAFRREGGKKLSGGIMEE